MTTAENLTLHALSKQWRDEQADSNRKMDEDDVRAEAAQIWTAEERGQYRAAANRLGVCADQLDRKLPALP